MEIDTHVELRREAGHLFTSLFGQAPPPELVEHYLRAHESVTDLGGFPASELHTMHLIVSRRLNAAIVEPWLRRKNGQRHAVSAKLLLVVYLAECGDGSPGAMRRASQSPFQMVSSAFRGVLGLLGGFYLKVRHGLI